jgi:hypothetical protein
MDEARFDRLDVFDWQAQASSELGHRESGPRAELAYGRAECTQRCWVGLAGVGDRVEVGRGEPALASPLVDGLRERTQ